MRKYNVIRRTVTLLGEATLSNGFAFLLRGPSSKGKNLLPLGVNSFLLEKIPFENGLSLVYKESNTKSQKVASLVNPCPAE